MEKTLELILPELPQKPYWVLAGEQLHRTLDWRDRLINQQQVIGEYCNG